MSMNGEKTIKYSEVESNDIKHFQVGYFTEKISTDVSKYLSEFIFLLKNHEERVFLHFNLPDAEDLEEVFNNKRDWTFLFKYEKGAKWPFLKSKNVYAVGYCESIEQLIAILQFAWNKCYESPVMLILTKEIDKQLIKEYDGRELAMNYSVVIERGHDGHCIDVFSKNLNLKLFGDKLKSYNERHGLKTILCEHL